MILMMFNMTLIGYGQENAAVEKSKEISDISGHWAEETIKKWIDNDLITGYPDESFKPNGNITKAEFITLVNRIYGYYKAAEKNYTDVKENDWYFDALAIAKENGYMSWHKGDKLLPNVKITRQEVCAIISAVLQLKQAEELLAVEKFSDKDDIPKWSKGYIDAVVTSGYMNGYPDGTLKPTGNITRAESVVMLNRVIGELINTDGTYGPEKVTRTVKGNLTINTEKVVLKNTTINGDLVLAAGIKDGDVDLENVIVKGKTIIHGGGENSITFKGSKLGEVIVYKQDGKIRVVSVDSEIGNTIMESGGKLEGEFKNVEIFGKGTEVELEGSFDSIIIETEVEIIVTDDTTIDDLEIAQSAEGSTIDVDKDAEIEELTLNGQISITGTGSIGKATINADGISIKQKVDKKVVKSGVDGSGVEEKSRPSRGGGLSSDENSHGGSKPKSSEKSIVSTNIGDLNNDGNLIDVSSDTTVKKLMGAIEVSLKAGFRILVASQGIEADEVSIVTEDMVIEVTAEDGSKAEYSITLIKSSTNLIISTAIGQLKGKVLIIPEGITASDLSAAVTISDKATKKILMANENLVEDKEIVVSNMLIRVIAEDGTINDYIIQNVILIGTADELDAIRDGLDKYYRLKNNIDLKEKTEDWEPIRSFTGSLDGDGFTISNLKIASTNEYQGLFGDIDVGGEVFDLNMDGVNIIGDGKYVGSIAGINKGTITNCNSTCSGIKGLEEVGGLVGANYREIINCSVTIGDIEDVLAAQGTIVLAKVGGLVGVNRGIISKSSANVIGKVIGRKQSVTAGVLVGANGGRLIESYSQGTAEVTGSYAYAGGLVGYNNNHIINCYTTGTASDNNTSGSYWGNLVGANIGGTIYTSNVKEDNNIFGWNNGQVNTNITIEQIKETDIQSGNGEIIIRLNEARWADLSSKVGNKIKETIIESITGSSIWTDIKSNIDLDNIVINQDNTSEIIISLPQVEDYDIDSDETISIQIPVVAVEELRNILEEIYGSIDLTDISQYGIFNKEISIEEVIITPPTPGNSGIVSIDNIGTDSIDLSWEKATDNVSEQGDLQYKVVRSENNNISTLEETEDDGIIIVQDWKKDISSITASGLTNNTTYYFNVIVKDEVGYKSVYTMTYATIEETPPTPGNSGIISIDNIGTDSIDLSWEKATDNVSQQGDLQYKVVRSESNNVFTLEGAEDGGIIIVHDWEKDMSSITVSSLTDSTTYYFNVIVKDEAGNKSVYTMVSGTTTDGIPPTPGNSGIISIDNIGTDSVELSWEKATDNVSQQGDLQYKVVRSESNNISTLEETEYDGIIIVQDWKKDMYSIIASSLTDSTTYYFNVIVKDEVGNKFVYTMKSASTVPPGVPSSYSVSGYFMPGGNGEYKYTGLENGKPKYVNDSNYEIGWNENDSRWEIKTYGLPFADYFNITVSELPPVEGWIKGFGESTISLTHK